MFTVAVAVVLIMIETIWVPRDIHLSILTGCFYTGRMTPDKVVGYNCYRKNENAYLSTIRQHRGLKCKVKTKQTSLFELESD